MKEDRKEINQRIKEVFDLRELKNWTQGVCWEILYGLALSLGALIISLIIYGLYKK